jgi:hypothetical protein
MPLLRRLSCFLACSLTLSAAFGAIDDSVAVLTKKYGKPTPNTYRPDLYPTSYIFKPRGSEITVTLLDDRAKKIDVFFVNVPVVTVETLLERYSGRKEWKPMPAPEPTFVAQFPQADAAAKSTAYTSGNLAALVQRDAGPGKLVLWIQTTDYPELLAAYRGAKKQG